MTTSFLTKPLQNRLRRSTFATLVVLLGGIAATRSAGAATSGIFGGGPFYKSAASNINEIRTSGFTEAIVWNIEVKSNGDLNFNGEFPRCSGGVYIGGQDRPDFASNMAALKTGTVKRITFRIGRSNIGDW